MTKSGILRNTEKYDFIQIFDFTKISEILTFCEKPIFTNNPNLRNIDILNIQLLPNLSNFE